MAEQQQQQHKTKRNRKHETCVGQRLPETSSSAGDAGLLGARLRLVRCDGSHGGGLAEGEKKPTHGGSGRDQDGISVDVWAEGGHSREKSDGWMSDFRICFLTKAAC